MAAIIDDYSSSEQVGILVVEDEGLIALDIENHLVSLGYQLKGIAETGQEATRKALELQPDLVLMDIRLKGEMDGIEAASNIVKKVDIPIIFLTAFADKDTIDRAKTISPFGYILKPFNRIDLRTSIEIALQKHGSEKTIRNQKNWLNVVLESIGDAVVTTDTDGIVTFMNRVAEKITQWDRKEAIGKDINNIIPLIDAQKNPIENPISQALRDGIGEKLPENTLLVTRNQQEVPVDDSAVLILDEKQQKHGAVIVFRDVTENLLAKQQLYHHAYYDSLTDLPNRTLFIDRLQHVVELYKRYSNCQFAVLFVDLDRFKDVNDSLGHSIGDRLLVLIAHRLKQCLRPSDTVSRFGGDEFAILLEHVSDIHTACELAERINQELSVPCKIDDHELFSSASIGIVFGQTQYKKAEDLIRDADIAMYHAKDKGKNRYEVFDKTMLTQIKKRLALEHDLRRAISNHSLTVYYQPIVSLASQEIVGFEALARWEHSIRGMIHPDIFIPIAEDAGLIVQLDLSILRKACNQLNEFHNKYPKSKNLGVSINLSSHCFSHPDLVKRITSIVTSSCLNPARLRLEITERALIENPESAAQILSELKVLGIQIYIDDFGTGYSSLSCLHQFPIDVLKIDRSFIQNTCCNTEKTDVARNIVNTIIVLANSLQMSVISEGVETAEQTEFVRELDCDYAQGYFFHRPLDSEQVKTLLAH